MYNLRHIARIQKITTVMLKNGLSVVVKPLGLNTYLKKEEKFGEIPESYPQSVRMTCEELGTTFIKLGQLFSIRKDLIPEAYAIELEKLQDSVKALAFSEIKKVMEDELGVKLEEIFEYVRTEPVGSASLSQVHEAKLRSGQDVVIKVQRPGIKEIIEIDLEIIQIWARILKDHTKWGKIYDFPAIALELEEQLKKELDFIQEGLNSEKLLENLKKNNCDFFFIPQIFWEFSTKRLIIFEKINGIKINDIEALDKSGADLNKTSENLVKGYFQQIFLDGYFHADPHPGNILWLEGNRIALMDFGIIGKLDVILRGQLTDIVLNVTQKDAMGVANALMKISLDARDMDISVLCKKIENFISRYAEKPASEVNFSVAFREVQNIAFEFNIRMPVDLALLGKTVYYVENVAAQLDKKLNIIETVKIFINPMIKERIFSKNLNWLFLKYIIQWKEIFLTFPEKIRYMMDKIIEGRFKAEIVLKGLSQLNLLLDKGIQGISISLLIAGILVSSSMLISTKQPFYEKVGAIGLLFTIVLLFSWLWIMFKNYKSKEK